jgi:Effector Associated Constant Component 1
MTPFTVQVEISEADADLRRIDQLSRNLLREFRAQGVEAERSREEAPAGSKSGTAVTVWALAVAVGNSPSFANLVSGMFGWLERGRGRTVKLVHGDRSIEISSASATQQRQLLAEWLEACAKEEEMAKGSRADGGHSS